MPGRAVCVLEQPSRPGEIRLPSIMQFRDKKLAFTAVWTVLVILAAMFANLKSTSSWAVLALIAAIPPTVLWIFWNAPAQSMSESIQRAKD